QNQDSYTLVIPGGSTPVPLFQHLSEEYSNLEVWDQVHVFWTDERYVSKDSERSNYASASKHLLTQVPILPKHVHSFPVESGLRRGRYRDEPPRRGRVPAAP
ncbi:MAG: 6-phosphogluconolactonase, partial [bacterium]